MIKIAVTGKADKRIITYPFMRACSIAGRTWVITDDVAYKRLYSGNENCGEIESIQIHVIPSMSPEEIDVIEEQAAKNETEYLIYITDSYIKHKADYVLMLCERNRDFLGSYIEDIAEEQENITFGTIMLYPQKNNKLVDGIQIYQVGWRPEFSMYLLQVEEQKQLLPLKDKSVSTLLAAAFAQALDLKAASFYELLKRKRYRYTKKD